MKLIPHNKKKTWENGDCLYMEKYLYPFDKKVAKGMEVLHLSYLHPNVVKAIQKLGFDKAQLEKYKCPYTDWHYYWAIPMTVLTLKDSPLYKLYSLQLPEWSRKMALDREWNTERREWNTEREGGANFEPQGNVGSISAALLGTGYTDSACIMNGSGSIEYALANLETRGLDGYLVFATHVWYNK